LLVFLSTGAGFTRLKIADDVSHHPRIMCFKVGMKCVLLIYVLLRVPAEHVGVVVCWGISIVQIAENEVPANRTSSGWSKEYPRENHGAKQER
jgi:hypothetical protein